MKQRILSAAAGIILAAVVFTLNLTKFPWLLNITLAIIACIALHEILCATQFKKNMAIALPSYAFTIFVLSIPAFPEDMWARLFACAGLGYLMVMFITLLITHKKLPVERFALAIVVTSMIAFPFYSMLYMYWKNQYDSGDFKYIGQSLVILCLIIAWMTDTGAYFTGVICGKHKLAPEISPKKTIEGAIGGFIFCILSTSGIAYLMTGPLNIVPFDVNWINLLVLSAVASVISMIGDLSFSIFKRAFNVKDFGNIMPGHGGVLDRFDSAIFVCPVVCLFNMWFPVIVK